VIRELFQTTGGVSRTRYLATGLLLFALKYTLDFLMTSVVFHRPWRWFPYLHPLGEVRGLTSLMGVDRSYALSMLALALPFIWIGTAMTVRRIHSAGKPRWLVVLFFIPVINLVMLALLCLLPERPVTEMRERAEAPQKGKAVTALAIAIPICIALVWLGASLLGGYGVGLFIALPFSLGMISVLIFNSAGTQTFRDCLSVAALSVVVPGGALLAMGMEGLGCLAMALPLALPLALIGGSVAWSIRDGAGARQGMAAILVLMILYPPAVMCAEYVAAPDPPLLAVTTSIEVDAEPHIVWHHVVSFSELPEPTEWIFQTGIAYPVRASIDGVGPGAIRRCEFSTGPFIEPIEIWDQPRLLRFSVTQNPAPMVEWAPYKNIHPKHLDNFLASRRGQFLLTSLPGGRTRLEGTTWYVHNLWPAAYWQAWSDFIIHRIHQRVLVHIKKLAEDANH
jgi:uncharacterized membrane protein YhaH (DUF805 family)